MKKYAVLAGIMLLMAALVAGCGGDGNGGGATEGGDGNGAAEGDRVQVHYTGTLDDGSVFDSSEGRAPLSFVIGDGSMIPGFDAAVRGMEVGEVKTVTIPAAEAYGEHDKSLVTVVNRDELPGDLVIGQQVILQNQETGELLYFTVTDISDTKVTLDANHKLAGEDLTFEIEMVAIEKGG